MRKAFARHAAGIAAAALCAGPAAAHDTGGKGEKPLQDPSIHGRVYTSHRQPGNYAFEGPGSWHGSPRHGFEVGAHWDRTWPPNGHPGFAPGSVGVTPCGVRRPCGAVPWPLGNLDIEVQPE